MLKIPKTLYDQMLVQADSEAPFECCGLLGGKNGNVSHLYKITNIVAMEGAELINFDDKKVAHLQSLSPDKRAQIAFVMDAQEMSQAFKEMRSHGIALQVFYHSHPNGPDHPSPTDIKVANDFSSTREILNQPEPLYVIISLETPDRPSVKAYRIVGRRFVEERLEVVAS
jgi:proteasome lid subunit RPN8/RPN11